MTLAWLFAPHCSWTALAVGLGWNPELLARRTDRTKPFVGITLITRTETLPRTGIHRHIAEIDF